MQNVTTLNIFTATIVVQGTTIYSWIFPTASWAIYLPPPWPPLFPHPWKSVLNTTVIVILFRNKSDHVTLQLWFSGGEFHPEWKQKFLQWISRSWGPYSPWLSIFSSLCSIHTDQTPTVSSLLPRTFLPWAICVACFLSPRYPLGPLTLFKSHQLPSSQ